MPANTTDGVTVPEGYLQAPVVRWGDPILAGAPAFDIANQSADAQAVQFGYNNDFIGFLRLDDRRALLVVNHEYTNERADVRRVDSRKRPPTSSAGSG